MGAILSENWAKKRNSRGGGQANTEYLLLHVIQLSFIHFDTLQPDVPLCLLKGAAACGGYRGTAAPFKH